MGFLQVALGTQVKIAWEKEGREGKVQTATFDIASFNSRIKEITGMEFVNYGNGKWKLRLCRGVSGENLIQIINSETANNINE